MPLLHLGQLVCFKGEQLIQEAPLILTAAKVYGQHLQQTGSSTGQHLQQAVAYTRSAISPRRVHRLWRPMLKYIGSTLRRPEGGVSMPATWGTPPAGAGVGGGVLPLAPAAPPGARPPAAETAAVPASPRAGVVGAAKPCRRAGVQMRCVHDTWTRTVYGYWNPIPVTRRVVFNNNNNKAVFE